MKILQVMAGGKHGGAETAFVDMCAALKEAGQDVEAVTRPNDVRVPALQDAGVKVHLLPFGGPLDLYTPWKLRRIICAFRPDIVQTWMSRAPQKTPAWNKGMNIPAYAVVARLGGYYKMKYFRTCGHFITITPDIKTYLEKNGIPPQNIRHINNFAETEDAGVPLDRAAFGIPQDAPLLLGLGRLHPAKAFDTLIRAVAGVPGVYAVIAGEGPQRQELEALIAALDVQERVRLLGWRSDRAALFGMCDICVFCSRYEPFGTVFVQAWAQKTPVIVSKADGPRQFVRDGEDALLVGIDDIPALQDSIKKLIENNDLRNDLVRNGHARYLCEFSKEQTLGAYLRYYEELIERTRTAKAV